MRALVNSASAALRRRTPVVLVSVAALLLLGAGPAQNPKLEIVIGTVVIGTGEPPVWRPAAEGDVLQPGDVVRTGADGRAELRVAAGLVRLYEESTLRLPQVANTVPGTDSVDLEEGASLFDIIKRRSGRDFEVRTPEAVVMVKGTRFSVSVDTAGAAVSVFRGLVGVRGLAKDATREVLVHEGFTAIGARSVPFTLDLMRARTDAWESWSKKGPRPVAEVEAHKGPGPRPEIEFARDATRLAMTKRMAAHMGMDREAIARHRDGARMERMHRDPITDSHNREMMDEIQETYAESTLGQVGQFNVEFIMSGGPDRVHITGPNLDDTYLQGTLEQVTQGNFGLLSPELLNVLSTQGVNPDNFANNLLNGLDK